uniref:DH domain-containing protein n=1 Tax=Spongospora subterranea TaxID=70186 RepID=A0A0H5RBG6_9EUKA|eukprot:CRZ10967.1 hypothetical protein [Spongospora subterranea]
MRPAGAVEKNWGKHRAERANLDKRDKLIQEVIDTERSYVASLQTMAAQYAAPLKENPQKYGVKREQVATVFENIDPIAAFHLIFLVELEKERNLAKVIIRFGDFLKMYTTFISTYDKVVRLLGQMRKSSKFTRFLDETRMHVECKGLDLMSFMIMPIQRIPRYELLLRELISCSEIDPDLNQAYDRIRYIAKHVNETQRHVENMLKLLEIQDRITNSDLEFDLLQPHRRLIKEGRLQQKTASKLHKLKPRVIFLFSDIILWTSTSNSYLGHIDLSCVTIKDHDSEKNKDITFRLGIDGNEASDLVWRCETPAECVEWREAINTAMVKLCEVFVSRLDEKDRERFVAMSGDVTVGKAEMLRQAKLSIRRKKYERQQGGAMHTFMKEKLHELQTNNNTIGNDDDDKESSFEASTITSEVNNE